MMPKISRFLFAAVLLLSGLTLPAQAALKTGDFALDFKLADLQKNTVELSAYRGKQPVLAFFWTTWCPYCRRALKDINDLYPALAAKGWEVLAINTGEPAQKVQAFVAGNPLSFKVLLDENMSVSNAYDILGVPTYVVVDKNGLVAFDDNYFPEQKIRELTPQ